MHIINITISPLRRSLDGRRVFADVTFTVEGEEGAENRQINIVSDAPLLGTVQPEAAILADAIRQLRRTPEARSGAGQLRFAKTLDSLLTGLPPMDKDAGEE